MNDKILRVIACAAVGVAIGFALKQAYQSFSSAAQPWKALGFISVLVTSIAAIVGMSRLMAMIFDKARKRMVRRAHPASQRPVS